MPKSAVGERSPECLCVVLFMALDNCSKINSAALGSPADIFKQPKSDKRSALVQESIQKQWAETKDYWVMKHHGFLVSYISNNFGGITILLL